MYEGYALTWSSSWAGYSRVLIRSTKLLCLILAYLRPLPPIFEYGRIDAVTHVLCLKC